MYGWMWPNKYYLPSGFYLLSLLSAKIKNIYLKFRLYMQFTRICNFKILLTSMLIEIKFEIGYNYDFPAISYNI